MDNRRLFIDLTKLTDGEKIEMKKLGISNDDNTIAERDYAEFNKIRTAFFSWMNLDLLPVSTGIQARLC